MDKALQGPLTIPEEEVNNQKNTLIFYLFESNF
jgi:hypothetical protein